MLTKSKTILNPKIASIIINMPQMYANKLIEKKVGLGLTWGDPSKRMDVWMNCFKIKTLIQEPRMTIFQKQKLSQRLIKVPKLRINRCKDRNCLQRKLMTKIKIWHQYSPLKRQILILKRFRSRPLVLLITTSKTWIVTPNWSHLSTQPTLK